MDWVSIKGWEGVYEINLNLDIRHQVTKRIKKVTISSLGYAVVQLWKNNKGKVCYLHDIVLATFLGEKPRGWCVNHINGIKSDYSFNNLEYTSIEYNNQHAQATGLVLNRGEHNYASKLTEREVLDIRQRANKGERTTDLAREFNVGSPIISQIKNRTRWKHLD